MEKMLHTWSQAVINDDHIVHGLVALWCDGGAHFQLRDRRTRAKPEKPILPVMKTPYRNRSRDVWYIYGPADNGKFIFCAFYQL